MATCFISYSWDNEEHKKWVDHLAAFLAVGAEVIYDQDRSQNPLGGNIPEFIGAGIHEADFVVVVSTPDYVEKANTITGYVGSETALILERLRVAPHEFRILPVLRAGSRLPAYLHGRHYIDMTDDAQFTYQATQLLSESGVLEDGIAPRDIVFGPVKLPGQVFAAELLNEPVWLSRHLGRTTITISRAGANLAVFTTPGKNKIVAETFPDDNALEGAKDLDRLLHKFLLDQTSEGPYPVRQPNLRWASGGVLSLVSYRKRSWIPFFFRDIPPYGWNISLGASEHKSDNLNDPWSFVMREFLEETLVCRPSDDGSPTLKRPFVFDHVHVESEQNRANAMAQRHARYRFQRDGMSFSTGDPVYVALEPTKTDLRIEGQAHPIRDIVACVNITELGVEIIKVVDYTLGDSDYILDGELLEPAGSQDVELIRMPVALIAYDFLEKVFKGLVDLDYRYEHPKLPSIQIPKIPATDIHIFQPDVIRRRDIALGRTETTRTWERASYERWYEKFGEYFLDRNNEPTNANASRLFTPAAAKSVIYYLENRELAKP